VEYKQVLETFVRETDTLIDLYVDGEVISTTEEHPFWVPDKGWVEAEDLQVGMLLQTDEETVVDVDRIERRQDKQKVYNFEVEDFHTYFVSDLGLLVHNNCADDLPLEDLEEWTGRKIENPFAREMAMGHAYSLHKDDFPRVRDRLEFAAEIEYIISNSTAKKGLRDGRIAYLDETNQIVVITNPKGVDTSTAYRPRDLEGNPIDARQYFNTLK
jgi:Pretoxin HINT domain